MKRLFLGLLLIVVAFLLLVFGLGLASGVALAHEPYTKWMAPNGGKCCSEPDKECRPVRSYYDDEIGRFKVLVDGGWKIVPPSAVLTRESPDGRSHACIGPHTRNIYCFVNGRPKS